MASFVIQIVNLAVVLAIVVILVYRVRTATPAEAVYRHKLIEAAVSATANNAIVITDNDNRIVLWNTGAEKLFGWKEDKVIGRSLDIISLNLPQIGLKDTPIDTEAMHSLESMIPINITVSECRLGSAVHYTAFMKSIRERKEREAMLLNELQLLNDGEEIGQFGSFMWTVNSPEMIKDRITVTEGFNRIFETEDTYSDIGYLMSRIYHEDQTRVLQELAVAQANKSNYNIKYRIQKMSGKVIYVDSYGKMFFTVNGNIEKIIGFIHVIKEEEYV